MEVRIKFSADLVITGCGMHEIKRKWENMSLFSKEAEDCGVEFCETLLIEDADNYDNLEEEFDEC